MNNKITGILVAMEEEAAPIIKGLRLDLLKEDNGCKIYSNNKTVLIVAGIGSLNACIGTVTLIKDYKCGIIYNTGTCGATGSKFKPCEILSVNRIYKRDVDLTLAGYKKYQYPGMSEFIELKADENFRVCDCYSSDEFVGENSVVPDDVIVEMEGYACAFVCYKLGAECRIYKVVSDMTESNSDDSQFVSNLDRASAALAEYIVKIINK